jgi:hypothetical protein
MPVTNIVYTRDFNAIRAVFIIILFWLSASYLADGIITYIHKKYDIELWKLHCLILVILLIVILIDPYTFEKL